MVKLFLLFIVAPFVYGFYNFDVFVGNSSSNNITGDGSTNTDDLISGRAGYDILTGNADTQSTWFTFVVDELDGFIDSIINFDVDTDQIYLLNTPPNVLNTECYIHNSNSDIYYRGNKIAQITGEFDNVTITAVNDEGIIQTVIHCINGTKNPTSSPSMSPSSITSTPSISPTLFQRITVNLGTTADNIICEPLTTFSVGLKQVDCDTSQIIASSISSVECTGIDACLETEFIVSGIDLVGDFEPNSFNRGYFTAEGVSQVTCQENACIDTQFVVNGIIGSSNVFICDGINSCPGSSTTITYGNQISCILSQSCLGRTFIFDANNVGATQVSLNCDGDAACEDVTVLNALRLSNIDCIGTDTCRDFDVTYTLNSGSYEIIINCDGPYSCFGANLLFDRNNVAGMAIVNLNIICTGGVGSCNNFNVTTIGADITLIPQISCSALTCADASIDNTLFSIIAVAFNNGNDIINKCKSIWTPVIIGIISVLFAINIVFGFLVVILYQKKKFLLKNDENVSAQIVDSNQKSNIEDGIPTSGAKLVV